MFTFLNSWLFRRHLEDDEEVILVVHKHWMIGLKYIFWPAVTFLILLILLYNAPVLQVFYIVAFLSIFTLVWGMRNFFDYYLDAWIITDTSIIDIEWHGWFHRQASRVLYSDVQGVSHEIQGVWNTLLRFGSISVEKVSTGNEIAMDNVKSPRSVEAVILKNMEDYLHQKNLKDSKTVQDILVNVIAREMQLKEFEEEEDDEEDDGDE